MFNVREEKNGQDDPPPLRLLEEPVSSDPPKESGWRKKNMKLCSQSTTCFRAEIRKPVLPAVKAAGSGHRIKRS
jgi:hypothetical protein